MQRRNNRARLGLSEANFEPYDDKKTQYHLIRDAHLFFDGGIHELKASTYPKPGDR